MKKLITLLSFAISLGAVAQTKHRQKAVYNDTGNYGYAGNGTNRFSSLINSTIYDSTHMTIVLTEDQMGKLFQLLNVSKGALIDTDIPGRQIKALSLYADSLNIAIQKQYTAWHPAKTDSTGKK